MRNVNISGVFVIRLCCDVVSLLRQRESTQLLQPLAVHDNRKSGQEVFGNREEEEEDRHLCCSLFHSVHGQGCV